MRYLALSVLLVLAVGCGKKYTPGERVPWNPSPVTPAAGDANPDDPVRNDSAVTPDAAAGCLAPSAVGTMTVVGGVVNGQSLTPVSPTVTVFAGDVVVGTIQVQITRTDGCATCALTLGATSTWDAPEQGYWCEASVTSASAMRTVSVSLIAPTQAGTYHVIVAGRITGTCPEVMSAGSPPAWLDGNDVAEWSSNTISQAISQGSVCVDWSQQGTDTKVRLLATAVRVVVQ